MTARLGDRLVSLGLPVAAGLIVLAATAVATRQEDPAAVFLILLAGCCAALLTVASVHVEPAWLLTGGLMLSIFSGNWEEMGLPLGPDRLLLLLGVAGALVRATQTAHSESEGFSLRPVHWLLLVLCAYATVSAVAAGTIVERASVFALLDKLGFVPFLLFLAAPVAFATERQRNVLLAAFVALGAYLGLTALFESVGLDELVFPSYITDPSVGIHNDRARGPFAEAPSNGLALFACAVAAAIAMGKWQNWSARAAAGAVAVLCIMGIAFTLTRQVWLGAALGTLLVVVVSPTLRRWIIPIVALIAVAAATAFAAVPALGDRAAERAGEERPVWDRLNSNGAALRMVEARPLVGFGWYRFQADSPDYYRIGSNYPLTKALERPHNLPLATAAELGLIGLGLLAAGLAIAVGGALLRRPPPGLGPWRIGLIAVATLWLVIANFAPLGHAFSNALLWLWAGVVMARVPDQDERLAERTG